MFVAKQTRQMKYVKKKNKVDEEKQARQIKYGKERTRQMNKSKQVDEI